MIPQQAPAPTWSDDNDGEGGTSRPFDRKIRDPRRLVSELVSRAKPNQGAVQRRRLDGAAATSVTLASQEAKTDQVEEKIIVAQTSVQRWYGVVQSIDDEYFKARLEPATEVGGASEVADFPISMVWTDDRALLKKGASFSYAVFRETTSSRHTVSALVFRRSPMAGQARIAVAEQRADRWLSLFNSDIGQNGKRAE